MHSFQMQSEKHRITASARYRSGRSKIKQGADPCGERVIRTQHCPGSEGLGDRFGDDRFTMGRKGMIKITGEKVLEKDTGLRL